MLGHQLFYLGIVAGFSIEVAVCGILTILNKLATTNLKSRVTISIIGTCNILCIFYALSQLIFQIAPNQDLCGWLGTVTNIISHVFFLSFDAFVLFVAYFITNKDIWVRRLSYLILFHRLVWAVLDVIYSSAQWDMSSHSCLYNQHQVTGAGYNLADFLCDCVATVSAVYISRKRFSKQSQLVQALIEKNVFRFLIISVQSSVLIYLSSTSSSSNQDAFTNSLAWFVQTYILARCINYDLLFQVDPDHYQTFGMAIRRASKSIRSLHTRTGAPDEEAADAWIALAANEAGKRCSVALGDVPFSSPPSGGRRGSSRMVEIPAANSSRAVLGTGSSNGGGGGSGIGVGSGFNGDEFAPVGRKSTVSVVINNCSDTNIGGIPEQESSCSDLKMMRSRSTSRSQVGIDRKCSQHSVNKISPASSSKSLKESCKESNGGLDQPDAFSPPLSMIGSFNSMDRGKVLRRQSSESDKLWSIPSSIKNPVTEKLGYIVTAAHSSNNSVCNNRKPSPRIKVRRISVLSQEDSDSGASQSFMDSSHSSPTGTSVNNGPKKGILKQKPSNRVSTPVKPTNFGGKK